MADKKGTEGEDIGRPGPWGEGRYQQPGQSIGESVLTPPGTTPGSNDPISTPVTAADYETKEEKLAAETDSETSDPPGGDAG